MGLRTRSVAERAMAVTPVLRASPGWSLISRGGIQGVSSAVYPTRRSVRRDRKTSEQRLRAVSAKCFYLQETCPSLYVINAAPIHVL